jgi:hypothetical protein
MHTHTWIRGLTTVFSPLGKLTWEVGTHGREINRAGNMSCSFQTSVTVPLEETLRKACVCLGMFNILIVLYTSTEL